MAKKSKPSVEQFKLFVRNHPKLRVEVRAGEYTWQQLFEEWYLLGGENEQWHKYKEVQKAEKKQSESSTDIMNMLMNMFKTMDTNQIQQYISNANQALGTISGIISSFQSNKPAELEKKELPPPRRNPFMFKKD
jgi:Putative coat protein